VTTRTNRVTIEAAALTLLDYCRSRNFSGFDPYDALNSPVLSAATRRSRRARLVVTQLLKRSPIDVRSLIGVRPAQNPKAIGLFLSGTVALSSCGLVRDEGLIDTLKASLTALRSPAVPYWCWGYSFPWQTRTTLIPRGAPNLVCTVFAGAGLLDAYESTGDARCLEMASSAADYIRDRLYWQQGSAAGFSYPDPSARLVIHNANFLGAAYLSRVAALTGKRDLIAPALAVARCSARQQRPDGSWPYGEAATQRWIDNFHTGYNLCALRAIGVYTHSREFAFSVRRGFDFYRAQLFRQDGAPVYYAGRSYPIDIHCVAQSIVTLTACRELAADNLARARGIIDWALGRMRDARGCFYYRVGRVTTIRTSFMRWSQAWMLFALATFIAESAVAASGRAENRAPVPA